MIRSGPLKKDKNKKIHVNKYAHMANKLGAKELASYNSMVEVLSKYEEIESLDFYKDFKKIRNEASKENYRTMSQYYNRTANDAKSKGKDLTSLL